MGLGIHIDKDWTGTNLQNSCSLVDTGICDGDHLITWANLEGRQRQVERLETTGNTYAGVGTTQRSEILLKSAHLFTQDIPTAQRHPS